MKKPLILLLFLALMSATLISAEEKLSLGNNIEEYNKIFQKISEIRSGTKLSVLDNMNNPFTETEKKDNNISINNETINQAYLLEAIINQKAKINGIWYKQNDMIDSYKLSHIDYNSVILKNGNETKELVIRILNESKIKIYAK